MLKIFLWKWLLLRGHALVTGRHGVPSLTALILICSYVDSSKSELILCWSLVCESLINSMMGKYNNFQREKGWAGGEIHFPHWECYRSLILKTDSSLIWLRSDSQPEKKKNLGWGGRVLQLVLEYSILLVCLRVWRKKLRVIWGHHFRKCLLEGWPTVYSWFF